MTTTIPPSEKHLKYLDSARGIAALMVFFNHYIARCFQDKMDVHWFFLIFNGNDAVSFFFVLSGFVLSYKYVILGKPLDLRKFYITRIFRLFPPYFLIIVLMTLFAYREILSLGLLRDAFLFNKDHFWEEALLFRFHNKLYYPGWTLTIEMIGSFLIPFFIALAFWNKRLIPWLIVVTVIIGNNISFSYLFLFGILASTNYGYITGDSLRQSKWYKYRVPLLIGACILFSLRQVNELVHFGYTILYLQDYLTIDFFTYSGIACFIFLVAILHSKRVQRFLENKVLVYLGKISYGIYLVHILVVDAVFVYVEKYITFPPDPLGYTAITLLVLGCVILAATILHYAVERPFIRLGKHIAGIMKPSLIISKAPAAAASND